MSAARLAAALVGLAAAAGCRKEQPAEPGRPAPVSRQPAATAEPAEKSAPEREVDPAWVSGMWQKEGEPRWLLFNPPSEVAELAGKPARVVRRGRLVVHGRYISAIFDDGEIQLEGTRDHAALSGGGGVYRRGSPP